MPVRRLDAPARRRRPCRPTVIGRDARRPPARPPSPRPRTPLIGLDPGPLRHRVQVGVGVEDRRGAAATFTTTPASTSTTAELARLLSPARRRRAVPRPPTPGSSLVNTGVGGASGRPTSIGTDSQRAPGVVVAGQHRVGRRARPPSLRPPRPARACRPTHRRRAASRAPSTTRTAGTASASSWRRRRPAAPHAAPTPSGPGRSVFNFHGARCRTGTCWPPRRHPSPRRWPPSAASGPAGRRRWRMRPAT